MTRAVVHYTDSNGFGGAERVMLQLLGRLDRARWRPVLLHHDKPGLARLVAGARELGAELRVVPGVSRLGELRFLPAFVQAIRAERPAVFHAHLPAPFRGRYGLLAAAISRVPAVVAAAHLIDDIPVPFRARTNQRLTTACVDRYIAVSEGVARRMRTRLGVPDRKIQVIRNGVEGGSAPLQADPGLRAALAGSIVGPIVLTVARLDAQKGHGYLLAAAADMPDVTFVLAGEGPERASLEAQARRLGIASRVRFLGHREDVPELLAACDVFVLPSRYEGLPLSVLEAMAAARPVVATAIEGTDEIVVHGETGLLVPPAAPSALADGIRTVLSDPALAARMGQAGRKRACREFSTSRMVDDVSSAYDELLERSVSARRDQP
jgi:glycosyltransferase involved in cell wall biosynthesis